MEEEEESGRQRITSSSSSSSNIKVDDPRKISSANLFSSFPQPQGPEDDEKEGRAQQYTQQHHHPHHGRRLSVSVSIMPFQETVLPVPLNHEDGGVRVFFCV